MLSFQTLQGSAQAMPRLSRATHLSHSISTSAEGGIPHVVEIFRHRLTSGRSRPCSINDSMLRSTKTPLKFRSARPIVTSFLTTISSQASDKAKASLLKSATVRDPPVRTIAKIRL